MALFASLLHHLSASSSVTCGTAVGNTLYDLSALEGISLTGYDADHTHEFAFAPCSVVSDIQGSCPINYFPMATRTQLPLSPSADCTILAMWSEVEAQWETLTNGVKLTLQNGQKNLEGQCDSSLAKNGVSVSFLCAEGVGATTAIIGSISHIAKDCLYIIRVTSPHACGVPLPPTVPPTMPPAVLPSGNSGITPNAAATTKNGLTIFFSICIVILAVPVVIIALYFLGGMLYNALVHKASGVLLVPHYEEVWSRLPELWQLALAKLNAGGGSGGGGEGEATAYAEFRDTAGDDAFGARPAAVAPLPPPAADLDML